jgi:probable rRNA maturation factor
MPTMTQARGGHRARQRPYSLRVEIVVDCQRWAERRGVTALLRRALAAAARAIAAGPGELAIVLTDDSKMRALNREWRHKDAPTNVLSFPARKLVPKNVRGAGNRKTPRRSTGPRVGTYTQAGGVPLLGDIVIAYETTEREARAEHKPFVHHLAHLAVHGFLHLAGYDHETDREAKTMEELEATILNRLDVPDPYVNRTATM